MQKRKRIQAAFCVNALLLCGCGGRAGLPRQAETQKAVAENGREAYAPDTGGAEAAEKESGSAEMPDEDLEGALTVSCFVEEEFLETAVKRFMEKYPGVTITVDSYEAENSADAVENYLTYLNTKIMSGDADDLLFTAYLPVEKYSELGVFEDLSGYVSASPEFDDAHYFMNVLKAAETEDGKLYTIPYRARISAVGFSSGLLRGHTEFEEELKRAQAVRFSRALEIAKQCADDADMQNAFMTQENEVSCMEFLVKERLHQFVDIGQKKAGFDTPAYKELLQYIKTLSDGGYFDSDVDFYNEEYAFAMTRDTDVQAAYYGLAGNADDAYTMPVADADGNVAISRQSFLAINSAADEEKKALAWAFIRYLLSDEAQTLPSLAGPAVNRKGMDAVAELYYRFYEDGNDGQGGVDEKEYRDCLVRWMEQVTACEEADASMLQIVGEENRRYFSGEQSLDETARNLQRKMEQYLNE